MRRDKAPKPRVGRRRNARRRQPKPTQSLKGQSVGDGTLCVLSVRLDRSFRDQIDAYAAAKGIRRSEAAGEWLLLAQESIRERGGIPATRVDDVLDALAGVRTVVELLGPAHLGTLRLLAHWAAQAGGLKVSEDELLAEVRAVGADEWEQVLGDAERALQAAAEHAKTSKVH